MGQAGTDELGSSPPVQLNYAQLIADYLDFDWVQPQAEPIALAGYPESAHKARRPFTIKIA
jgi:hypothetical protein